MGSTVSRIGIGYFKVQDESPGECFVPPAGTPELCSQKVFRGIGRIRRPVFTRFV
jgi:hypothetical protein